MSKIIILQTVYKLSIEQTELQIRGRLSFRDFLDLAFSDTVPDTKTIWLFVEQLKKQDIEQQLFDRFNAELEERGFRNNNGLFVAREQNPVRKQRRKCEMPELSAHPTKMASYKVLDTTYTQNKNVTVFYKLLQNNVILDDEHKFIRRYCVTTVKRTNFWCIWTWFLIRRRMQSRSSWGFCLLGRGVPSNVNETRFYFFGERARLRPEEVDGGTAFDEQDEVARSLPSGTRVWCDVGSLP